MGLGMILNGQYIELAALDPLHCTVVGVELGYL
jgi:hypothetical protein